MAKKRNLPAQFVRVLGYKYALILIAVLLAIAVAIAVWLGLNFNAERRNRMVNFGLEDVGELVTQVGHFTNVQVDKEARDLWGMTLPFTQSKYIYSYDGTVKASIDFAQITIAADHEQKQIIITLPEDVKLDVTVDPNSMVIYDESRNIFTPLNLERTNAALVQFESEVRDKAIGNGIEQFARDNAKLLVKSLVAQAVASEGYTIIFADEVTAE